jgi:hypothetical protein
MESRESEYQRQTKNRDNLKFSKKTDLRFDSCQYNFMCPRMSQPKFVYIRSARIPNSLDSISKCAMFGENLKSLVQIGYDNRLFFYLNL